MEGYLRSLPKNVREIIYRVGALAQARNEPAYLVGGFVRDLILGVENLDIDIVIEGKGINFAEQLSEILKAKLIRHLRFGTATLILGNGLKVDIATARKEYYPAPAHLPVVESSSLKDDHFRRDFTINAMAVCISPGLLGQIVDFFGGREDIKRKKIRILHDLSFIDDPTRILRAIRFEQRYDFIIEANTLRRLKHALRAKVFSKLQPHRTRDEVILTLKEKNPLGAIRRINRLVGFDFLICKPKLSQKTFRLLENIEREVICFNKGQYGRRPLEAWVVYLIALFDDLRPSEVKNFCRKFAFPKGCQKSLISYKGIKPAFTTRLSRKELKASEVYALLEPLSYEVIVAIKAKFKNKYLNKHIRDFLKQHNRVRIHITGEDLRVLGIKPGPFYQTIMKKVLSARLNGLPGGKDEELSFVRRVCRLR